MTKIKYQQNLTSKLSKYLTCFDYLDKISIVFLTVCSGINIFSHAKGRKQSLGLGISVFSLFSALTSGIIKKCNKKLKKKKKKHNKLLYLAKNKLDCIEMLISQAIEDQIITHDELKMILHEKKQCNSAIQ